MKYRDLVEEALLSPSVFELLVDERRRALVMRGAAYPSFAFRAGLLYTALLQAYTLARSIKEGCRVEEMGYPRLFIDNLRGTWALEERVAPSFREGKPWVFSFLTQCARGASPALFGEEAARGIEGAKRALIQANKNARSFELLLSEEELRSYLRALPLLRTTEIDQSGKRFIFRPEGGGEYTIDYQPFLYFWDRRKNARSDEKTPDCYVIASARKGARGGELLVDLLPLEGTESELSHKEISWQASRNETVRMILECLGIPTDWFSGEEYFCDLEFMQRLATAAEEVLPRYWEIRGYERATIDIRGHFAALFRGSEIAEGFLSRQDELFVSGIANVLFGLFIKHGIFRTIRDMFEQESREGRPRAKELFYLFLDTFVEKGYITAESREEHIADCRREIEAHLSSLAVKVPYEDSPQFCRRRDEIRAEWYAFTLLRAAGIRADNLFADKESIYSIDDFFNMIRNPRTAVCDDLAGVLRFLISLYGALLDNAERGLPPHAVRWDEDRFYRDMREWQKELAETALPELFERFEALAEASRGHAAVKALLGREAICEAADIADFKNDILDALSESIKEQEQTSPRETSAGRYLFISYCHEDAARVQEFVAHCREKGIRIFIDAERFTAGRSWTRMAKEAIRHPDCAAVLVFMSPAAATSDPIRSEIRCAEEVGARREKGTGKRFLLPVNLVEEPMATYIDKVREGADGFERDVATFMLETFHSTNIYLAFESLLAGEQDADLIERLSYVPTEREEIRDVRYTPLELCVAKFYTFLKYGRCYWRGDDIDPYFRGTVKGAPALSHCIYPILASMKETKIHRDNITMLGYEMVNGFETAGTRTNYILASRPLSSPDDYYCIPHAGRVGEDCSWMLDPLLISYKRMTEK